MTQTTAYPAFWIRAALAGKGYGPFTDMAHAASAAADEIERLRAALERISNERENNGNGWVLTPSATIASKALNHV